MYQFLSGDEAGLVAYYPLDEEESDLATNYSANKFDGTLIGDISRSIETHPYGTLITGNPSSIV